MPPITRTSNQMLLELVPDFQERLNRAKIENPDLFAEIMYLAIETETGWRPLDYLQGAS